MEEERKVLFEKLNHSKLLGLDYKQYFHIIADIFYKISLKNFTELERKELFEKVNHSKLLEYEFEESFPLLEHLIDIGDSEAKKIFKEEVTKRVSSGSVSMIEYILQNEYLKYFTEKERIRVFKQLNHSKLLEQDYEQYFMLLEDLIDIGDSEAKKVFKEEVTKRLSSGNPNVIAYILYLDYLKDFTKEERIRVFKQLNHSKLLELNYTRFFPLLEHLIEIGDSEAKKIFKEEVAKGLLSGSPIMIADILDHNCLKYFTEEEKIPVFKQLDHSKLLELNYSRSFPPFKELIDAGDFEAKKIFIEEIARRFSSEDLGVITYILYLNYLKDFTEEERKGLFAKLNHSQLLELDYKQSFSLLKILIDLGDPVARKLLKEELAKRFASGIHYIIKYILQEKYLEDFTKEEKKDLFKKVNRSKLLEYDFEESFPLFKQLIKVGDFITRKLFKAELAKRFASGDFHMIEYLLQEKYLDDFTEEERTSIFEKLNHSKLLELDYERSFPLLKELIALGDTIAKKQLKEEIIRRVETASPRVMALLLKGCYFNYFSKEELGIICECWVEYENKLIPAINNYLDLSNQRLTTLPDLMGNLVSLQKLSLNSNKITTLPA